MTSSIDCGTAFCTEPSMRDYLTNSLSLSKLKNNPGAPMVGRILLLYVSLLCTLPNSSNVGSYGFFHLDRTPLSSIFGDFALLRLCFHGYSQDMDIIIDLRAIRPLCEKSRFCVSRLVFDTSSMDHVKVVHHNMENPSCSAAGGLQ